MQEVTRAGAQVNPNLAPPVGGTVHENCFWIFGFVARIRARADNVFKENVNNREVVENTQNMINFIND